MADPEGLPVQDEQPFRFHDHQGEGLHSCAGDLWPMARRPEGRMQRRVAPNDTLLEPRCNSDNRGAAKRQGWIDCHSVLAAFQAHPQETVSCIGSFDPSPDGPERQLFEAPSLKAAAA